MQDDKVFCIGLNKTGTTSLEQALAGLGYRLGSQAIGESLLKPWLRREFAPIVEFCGTADAFQDIPFSLPFTFIALDQRYPRARFILSVRDSAEQWYDSVIKFTRGMYEGELPSADMLRADTYRYPGFMWDAQVGVLGCDERDPFERQVHLDFYNRHNADARDYFRGRDNFLEINIADSDSYLRTCEFLGRSPGADRFPWLNRSED